MPLQGRRAPVAVMLRPGRRIIKIAERPRPKGVRAMPVGKARAAATENASEGFHFVVPCYTAIDEARIRHHLERDHFFWLDLTAPGHEQVAKLGDVFGFHPLALEDT